MKKDRVPMNVQQQIETAASGAAAHFDVIIAGAGISGVGAAYHLTKQCPGTSFRGAGNPGRLRRNLAHPPLSRHPLRQRPAYFRLPLQAMDQRADRDGRGNSQLYGRGDRGKPARPPHPLSAPDPLGALVERTEISGRIEAVRTDSGEAVRFTTNFFWMCQGYYRHAEGYTPQWPGMETFKGRIVHPQKWPDDLDYKDKRSS